MLNEYFIGLLGNRTIVGWLLAFTFILVGVIISLCIQSMQRDKLSKSTPYKWNFWFLLRDNFTRFIGSVFIAFALVRFGEEITGKYLSDIGCFTLGLCFDMAFVFIEKWQAKAREVIK